MPPRTANATAPRPAMTQADARANEQQAFALVMSGTFNSRNLEYYTYTPWVRVLRTLADESKRLHIGPQFPMWFRVKSKDDKIQPESPHHPGEKLWLGDEPVDEDVADEFVPVDVHPIPTQSAPPELGTIPLGEDAEENKGFNFLADMSAATEAVQTTKSVLIDFTILQLRVTLIPKDAKLLRQRYGPFRVVDMIVHLVVELKRAATRSGTDEEHSADLESVMLDAQTQAQKQVTYTFVAGAGRQEVLAIAGAGDYWTHARFKSSFVSKNERIEAQKKDEDYYAGPDQKRGKHFIKWSKMYRLNTTESDKQLLNLRLKLGKMEKATSEAPLPKRDHPTPPGTEPARRDPAPREGDFAKWGQPKHDRRRP